MDAIASVIPENRGETTAEIRKQRGNKSSKEKEKGVWIQQKALCDDD